MLGLILLGLFILVGCGLWLMALYIFWCVLVDDSEKEADDGQARSG